jgi:hypothetical protein
MEGTLESPLHWPDGWERTLIGGRKAYNGWKKTHLQSVEALKQEISRMKPVPASYIITFNPAPSDRMDPGAAVFWSGAVIEDYSWQTILGLDTVPTLMAIEDAFRKKALPHHPDRGGDPTLFQQYLTARDRGKAWVLGTHKQSHDYSIACDRYTETRWNLNALRMALSYLRGLDRVGVPGVAERSFKGFKQALPAKASSEGVA